MSAEKLVRMANQIADFFRTQEESEAVAGTADHIRNFWNPVMRKQIYDHIEHGGTGLNPLALKALKTLQSSDAAAKARDAL